MFEPLEKRQKHSNAPNLEIRELQMHSNLFSQLKTKTINVQPILLLHEPFSGFPSVGYVFEKKICVSN